MEVNKRLIRFSRKSRIIFRKCRTPISWDLDCPLIWISQWCWMHQFLLKIKVAAKATRTIITSATQRHLRLRGYLNRRGLSLQLILLQRLIKRLYGINLYNRILLQLDRILYLKSALRWHLAKLNFSSSSRERKWNQYLQEHQAVLPLQKNLNRNQWITFVFLLLYRQNQLSATISKPKKTKKLKS